MPHVLLLYIESGALVLRRWRSTLKRCVGFLHAIMGPGIFMKINPSIKSNDSLSVLNNSISNHLYTILTYN